MLASFSTLSLILFILILVIVILLILICLINNKRLSCNLGVCGCCLHLIYCHDPSYHTVDNNESCRQTLLDAELNDFVNIHNLESQSSAPSSYQRYQQQTNNDPKSDISNFSFRTVHEEFRKQFLADERERRRRKEVAEAPLIDI